MDISANQSYDYVIIGAGAAGLHLALAMVDDPWFEKKKILLLDADAKNKNDRTWCFWEEGTGKWDGFLTCKWKYGRVHTSQQDISLDMGHYAYKMIRGLDFYDYARAKLKKHLGFEWHQKAVSAVADTLPSTVSCSDGSHYQALHVFDSRIPLAYAQPEFKGPEVKQHFLGWFVQTDNDVFNHDSFVMMDFRVTYNDTTCFTYVLPFGPRNALVEFTLFTPDLIESQEYEECLKRYLTQVLHCDGYSISETEYGVIPMTSFRFDRHHGKHISLIGTAGGWVKPSTGYSFKNAERYASQMVANIKHGVLPHRGIAVGRHRKYDLLLLDIFNRANHLGNAIFARMYSNNKAFEIFRFLDGKSSLWQDLKVIASLPYKPFLKSLFRHFKSFVS